VGMSGSVRTQDDDRARYERMRGGGDGDEGMSRSILFKVTAATEIYNSLFVGSVRCL